jgi:hypothetical protein
MIDYGLTSNYERWDSTTFRPALFIKAILDKIFSTVGWSYDSSFFNTTRFKSLVAPYSSPDLLLSNSAIYDRSFLAATSGTTNYSTGTLYNWQYQSPIKFPKVTGTVGGYDLHNTSTNAFNLGTGIWTSNTNGKFQFAIQISMIQNNGKSIFASNGKCGLFLIKVSGGITSKVESRYVDFFFQPGQYVSDQRDIIYTSQEYQVNTGDQYYWAMTFGSIIDASGRQLYSNSDITVDVLTDSVFSLIPKPNVVYGDTIDMNSVLPTEIKATDFIMGLSKMFNLYFDQTEERKLLIEPREDYLTSDLLNWTTKIDISKKNPPKYVPLALSQYKQYKFNYDLDSDYLNKVYDESYKEVYGTKRYEVTTDFLKDTKEIKPIFAATPLSNTRSGTNNRIISDMRFADDNLQNVKQGKTKLRILYWGGVLNCSQWSLVQGTTSTNYTSYPYAGHLDNPFTPTFDLSYDSPIALFYSDIIGQVPLTYSDANLYNIYWDKTIKDITNKNSRVLEAFFNLTVFDWITISFRKQIFIKDTYYRLLEIEDFDIQGDGLTKCKLLKSDYEAPISTGSKPIRGGSGVFDSGGKVPVNPLPNIPNDKVKSQDTVNDGNGGYTTGINTINKGSNNNLPFSAFDSYVFGSNNVTVSSPRNFVFNSDGEVMNDSGAIFNGVYLEKKFSINFGATFIQEIDGGTATEYIAAPDTNQHYEVTKVYLKISGGSINYAAIGSGNILIKANSVTLATILGADWLGEGAGVTVAGTTAQSVQFGYGLTIEMDGTWSAGDRDLQLVLFYKLISL